MKIADLEDRIANKRLLELAKHGIPPQYDRAAIYRDTLEQIVQQTHNADQHFATLGSVRGKLFLDLGSASGFDCVEMAQAGAYAIGVELSDGRIEFDRELMGEKKARHCIVKADAGLPPFKEGVFDLIQCKHLIEHLSKPADRIKTFVRLLSPGGALCIDFPNRYHIKQVLSDDHYKLPLVCLLPRPVARYLVVRLLKYEAVYSTNVFLSVPFFEKTVKALGSQYRVIYPESELIKSKLQAPDKIHGVINRWIVRLLARLGLISLVRRVVDQPFFRAVCYPNVSVLIVRSE